MSNKQIYSDNVNISSTNNSLHKLSQIIQNYDKIIIKEIEPTTRNINYGDDSDINIIDELVDLIFMELNKENSDEKIRQCVLDYINNHDIDFYDIYNWLLNNQNNSNSVYLLGNFIYYGIKINDDTMRGYELIHKASILQNKVAHKHLNVFWTV